MPSETTILSDLTENDALRYPNLLTRIQSLFIDAMIVLLLTFLAAKILDKFETVPDWVRIVLFFGIGAIYEPLAMSMGCTAGNYLLGIRAKRYRNQQKSINILQAFVRYIIKACLGWMSFIAIHFNPDKRAIHDFASGSIMIKLPKK